MAILNFATVNPVISLKNTVSVRGTCLNRNRAMKISFLIFNFSPDPLADKFIGDSVNFREDIWHILLRQLNTEDVPRNGYVVGATTNVRQSDLINEAQRMQNVADQTMFQDNATSEIALLHLLN